MKIEMRKLDFPQKKYKKKTTSYLCALASVASEDLNLLKKHTHTHTTKSQQQQ